MGALGTYVVIGALLFTATPVFSEEAATAETPADTTHAPDAEANGEGESKGAETAEKDAVTKEALNAIASATQSTDLTEADAKVGEALAKLEEELKTATEENKKTELQEKIKELKAIQDRIKEVRTAFTNRDISKLTAEAERKRAEEAEAKAKAESQASVPLVSTHNSPGTPNLTQFQPRPAPSASVDGNAKTFGFDNGAGRSTASGGGLFRGSPAPTGKSSIPNRVATASPTTTASSTSSGVSIAAETSAGGTPTAGGFATSPIVSAGVVNTASATTSSGGVFARAPAAIAPSFPDIKVEAPSTEVAKAPPSSTVTNDIPDSIRRPEATIVGGSTTGTLVARPGPTILASNEITQPVEGRAAYRNSSPTTTKNIYLSTQPSPSDGAKSGANGNFERPIEKTESLYASAPKVTGFYGVKSTTAQIRGQGEYIQLGVKDESPTTDTINLVAASAPAPKSSTPLQIAKVAFKPAPTYNSPSGIKDPLQTVRGMLAPDTLKTKQKHDFQAFRENPFL